jgi:hypothetical protein
VEVTEFKVEGSFPNTQNANFQLLISLGLPQPPAPVKAFNATAHRSMLQESIYWDMRYYWLKDIAD